MAETRTQQRGSSYPPYVPARDVEDVRDRLGRLFNAPFNRLFREPATAEFGAMTVGWTPSVDVGETEKEYLVTAELPGMVAKDVRVEFDDGQLMISGEKRDERQTEDRRYHVWERTYGAFQRMFAFPADVDPEKIAAKFDDGVLTVRLPKTTERRPKAKRIEVGSGK